MAVSLQAGARPPYVEFVERTFEDRAATIAQGAFVSRSEDYVIVRQVGSKDTFEKNAKEWLDSLSKDVNMAPEWAAHFRSQYKAYKEGHEITPDGIHVKTWPLINRSQADNLIRANIRTVEDLARASEQALMAVGIGARELQHKAVAFLETASNSGKSAEELVALRNTVSQQADMLAAMRATIQRMETKLDKRVKVDEEDFLTAGQPA